MAISAAATGESFGTVYAAYSPVLMLQIDSRRRPLPQILNVKNRHGVIQFHQKDVSVMERGSIAQF